MRPPSLRASLLLSLLAACGSRTGLNDQSYVTDTLYCGGRTINARPAAATRIVAGVPRYAEGSVVWSVTAQPAGAQVTLTHSGHSDAMFTADREGSYVVRVSVPARPQGDGGVADSGVSEVTSCEIEVTVRFNGPTAICPSDITTAPLRAVSVTGASNADGAISSRRWTLTSAPSASSHPSPMPDDRAAVTFTPDVAGDYRLRYEVTDDRDRSDACTTVVHAVPTDGLRVEMFWNPPGRTCPSATGAACDGSDVDLHLLRASAGLGWGSDDDCHWFNCNASTDRFLSWTNAGSADDPRLDLDDVTGHGPENINVTSPSERSYRVGAHYFNAHGAGAQSVTLIVYCSSSTPAATLGPVTLNYRGSRDDSDFWMAADVLPAPGGAGCTVRPISRAGAPWIVSWTSAQRDPGPPAP